MPGLTELLLIELLLAAFGIAINPPAVIASIVLATSSRRKAVAFAGGWLVGLLLIVSLVMILGDFTLFPGEPSKAALAAKLAVGVVLIALALSQWRKHRSRSAETETPRWMRSLDDIPGPRAFLVALAYASLNPKTLAFVVAGALAVLEASLAVRAEWAVLVLFALLSSLTVSAPVAFAVLAPQRSRRSLAIARRWLGDNGSVITAAVLAVLGVMVLYSGITGLAQLE